MSKTLSANDIAALRQRGLLAAEETAMLEGDIVIAVHAVTGERRILKTEGILLEHGKQLLKG